MGERNINLTVFYSFLITILLGIIIYLLLSDEPTVSEGVGASITAFFLAIFGVIFIIGLIRILIPSSGKKKQVVETLRAWGLLDSIRYYDYFKEVQAMPFYQRLEEFGEEFIEDYITIMHLKTLKKIKQYIESLDDAHRKIRIAVTYLEIKKYQ